MSANVAYSARKEDLITPYKGAVFFPTGVPNSEGALCAEMARLAYCRGSSDFAFDQETITNVLNQVGFTNCQFFESVGHSQGGGTHCFLAVRDDGDKSKKLAILSFRGTDADDPTDLAVDANTLRTPWEVGGTVHQGFAKALNEVRPTLDPALQAINYKIIFTGHSLGAALATLQASVRKPNSLFTFGSPLVGDSHFITTLNGLPARRYVDCCDIVTRVPPAKLGFEHLGIPYYIDMSRNITFNPNNAMMKNDQALAREHYLINYAWKVGNVPVRDLADHAPINYVTAVTANDPPEISE